MYFVHSSLTGNGNINLSLNLERKRMFEILEKLKPIRMVVFGKQFIRGIFNNSKKFVNEIQLMKFNISIYVKIICIISERF
jgi:hypothetical protein